MLPEPSFFALQSLLDTLNGFKCFLLLAFSGFLQVDPIHLDHNGSDDLLHLKNLVAAL